MVSHVKNVRFNDSTQIQTCESVFLLLTRLTAIYKKEGDRKKFICGGTLISSHHVVTGEKLKLLH